jgi:deoxyadenosine/deoxycytidine kinase
MFPGEMHNYETTTPGRAVSDRPYIVIEGVIGAGKTTLAEKIAERLDAKLILEQHEQNPFLVDFYRDPKHFAFQTELFFLLSRYRQQTEELAQPDLFQQHVISDYHFAKNRIFASITLDEREHVLYDTLIALLERDIPVPDLVVYLQSSPQRLMRNIRLRDRDYERSMSQEYIETLVEAYNHFFFRYDASPLLLVNSTEIDFVRNPAQFDDLFERIMNAPDGTTYYNPASGGLV